MAHSAFGTILKRGDGTTPTEAFTAIAAVKEVTPPALSADTIDVTTHSSTDGWKEFIGGLLDGGEVTFTLVFDPNLAGHTAISGDLAARSKRNFKLEFPVTPTVIWSFSAIVTKFAPQSPIDGALTAQVTLKVTGKPTLA